MIGLFVVLSRKRHMIHMCPNDQQRPAVLSQTGGCLEALTGPRGPRQDKRRGQTKHAEVWSVVELPC